MRPQHVHRLRQALRLHPDQQAVGTDLGFPEAFPHSPDCGDGGAGIKRDGIREKVVGGTGLED